MTYLIQCFIIYKFDRDSFHPLSKCLIKKYWKVEDPEIIFMAFTWYVSPIFWTSLRAIFKPAMYPLVMASNSNLIHLLVSISWGNLSNSLPMLKDTMPIEFPESIKEVSYFFKKICLLWQDFFFLKNACWLLITITLFSRYLQINFFRDHFLKTWSVFQGS